MQDATTTLETARLILRPPQLGDLDRWAEFMADPQTAEPTGGVQPRSVAWRSLMTAAGAWALTGFGMFSVLEKSTGTWIGRLGPWHPDGWPGTEVGWGLRREHWGRGYATEGSIAAIDWAFARLGWQEVVHMIAPGNGRSQAVARRLGSRCRGPAQLPAPFAQHEIEVWGQSRAEWQAVRPRLPLAEAAGPDRRR